jgi:transposase
VGSLPAGARGDLTNRQWRVLKALLPKGKKPGGPAKWTKRQLINGIRWRTRTGAPWRDVPARYGTWQRVYGLFRSWQRDGTWARILSALQGLARGERPDHVGCLGGLHDQPGAPARRRRPP